MHAIVGLCAAALQLRGFAFGPRAAGTKGRTLRRDAPDKLGGRRQGGLRCGADCAVRPRQAVSQPLSALHCSKCYTVHHSRSASGEIKVGEGRRASLRARADAGYTGADPKQIAVGEIMVVSTHAPAPSTTADKHFFLESDSGCEEESRAECRTVAVKKKLLNVHFTPIGR
ncbi:hypothetical protein MHYP_G00074190 [Metynnis hypsauchen]